MMFVRNAPQSTCVVSNPEECCLLWDNNKKNHNHSCHLISTVSCGRHGAKASVTAPISQMRGSEMLPYCPGLPASIAELGFRPRSGWLQSEHLVPQTGKAADPSLEVENQERQRMGILF